MGTFFLPLVLLGVLLWLAPIRKVFFYRPTPAEATAQSAETAHFIAPDQGWQKSILALTLITLAIWVLVTIFWPAAAHWLTQDDTRDGEPMTLFEGISIWPTIASRTLGIILSLFLICYTLRVLEINRRETMHELGIPERKPDPDTEEDGVKKSFARRLLRSLRWPFDKQ